MDKLRRSKLIAYPYGSCVSARIQGSLFMTIQFYSQCQQQELEEIIIRKLMRIVKKKMNSEIEFKGLFQ